MSGTFAGTRSNKVKSPVTYLATIAGIALIAVAIPVGAAQASATAPSPTIGNVDVTGGITLTGLTPSFTLTGIPGVTVTTAVGAVSMLVTTNNAAGYAVTVQAAGATLVPADSGTNPDTIPIAALMVRESTTSANPTTALEAWQSSSSTAPVTVHTQAARSAANGDTVANDYQMLIPAVAVDTYSQTLNYVATTL